MKKIAIVMVLIVMSCTKTKEQTKDYLKVSEIYTEALIRDLDFKKAEKYSLENMEDVKHSINMIYPSGIKDFEFSVLKDSVIENVAWVKYKLEDDFSYLKLLKQTNGKWKVVTPLRKEQPFFKKNRNALIITK